MKRFIRPVKSFEPGFYFAVSFRCFFSLGSLNQNLGWGPILVSLQVPELTIEEFLQECLSLGSYLTLYVYLLQCLNSEQTLRNEMKVLLLLSKWLEQVYPRCVGPLAAVSDPLGLERVECRTEVHRTKGHRGTNKAVRRMTLVLERF